MIERTEQRQLGGFLTKDFCRVGATKAREICKGADMTGQTWIKTVGHTEAEKLYESIQKTRIIAPNTDCLVPIGSKALLAGLLKEVKAEFFAASTRPPNVYRGNPFQIEVAIGYGGGLGRDDSAKVLRFANRVPLLYSQSSCCSFKAVAETSWKNYGLTQPKNSIPSGPLVVMIHMVSVWVPFTSESKEAIADYDEIRKEMKLALQECGRKLGTYLRRRKRMARETERRSVFERYIGEISRCCNAIVGADTDKLYKALLKQAKRRTDEADAQLDDEGQVVDNGGRLGSDEGVIIVDELQDIPDQDDTLFGKTTKKKTKRKTTRKRGKK
jgi:DNA topoisomerase-6 subunit B